MQTPKFSDSEETFRTFRAEGTQILATTRHGRSIVEQHISSLNDGHIKDKAVVSPAAQPALHEGNGKFYLEIINTSSGVICALDW